MFDIRQFATVFLVSLRDNMEDVAEEVLLHLEEEYGDGDREYEAEDILEDVVTTLSDRFPNPPLVPDEQWTSLERELIRSIAAPLIEAFCNAANSILEEDEV